MLLDGGLSFFYLRENLAEYSECDLRYLVLRMLVSTTKTALSLQSKNNACCTPCYTVAKVDFIFRNIFKFTIS